ncbi:hypothetical protein MKK64_04605 [Methylobacterium sp. E-025]|uniref:hypothetical protein n=1 Tax=Methylobacterium sp. E-025 TaxID=2836561 RepID=UPI001FBA91C0|nr:hypothetical protein [Methylobacterium sp. E-025]MCJ2110494.1 hypothetical protein [Methylobacterium sp. E-025]
MTNAQDKFRPGRPIRERQAARFYDSILEQIPAIVDTRILRPLPIARPSTRFKTPAYLAAHV